MNFDSESLNIDLTVDLILHSRILTVQFGRIQNSKMVLKRQTFQESLLIRVNGGGSIYSRAILYGIVHFNVHFSF